MRQLIARHRPRYGGFEVELALSSGSRTSLVHGASAEEGRTRILNSPESTTSLDPADPLWKAAGRLDRQVRAGFLGRQSAEALGSCVGHKGAQQERVHQNTLHASRLAGSIYLMLEDSEDGVGRVQEYIR